MFLLNGNRLAEGTSFYDANGVQYGSGWLNTSTEAQKLAIGITWVADPAPFDSRFYWDTDLPKALEDKLETKEDGSPLYKQVYDKTTESMVDTTDVHGIADTSVLATNSSVASDISTHNSVTTNVHGIANKS